MNGSEEILNKLDELLTRVEDEIHELDIADADMLEESAWYQSSRQTRKAILRDTAQTTLYRPPRTSGPHLRRVDVADDASVRPARDLAFTPLSVIVENFSSDGALIKFALNLLATPDTHRLCLGQGAKAAPPAFEIESPGGHGDIPKLIQRRIDEATARGIRPRVLVVVESDGEWIGDEKAHLTKLREDCAARGIPCPPLTKRTAENYIPDRIWRAWAADHPKALAAINALLRLSRDQRDHVHICKANNSPWDASKPDAFALFGHVSAADESALKAAGLKGRAEADISSILSRYASASDRNDLLSRDHRGDLLTVVQHIKDEL